MNIRTVLSCIFALISIFSYGEAAIPTSVYHTDYVDVDSASMPQKSPSLQKTEANSTATYTNPVIDVSVPDPTWFRDDDGTFYLYGTENTRNVPIYKSTDMVNWDFVGTAFTESTRPSMVPDGGIWAPDIQKMPDRYLLYFSKSKWGGTWECGIGVARSDRPTGGFSAAKKLFLSSEIDVENSIDPFVYEEDGHLYLFWGSFHGIYAIQLSDNGLSIAKGAEKVQVAGTLTEGTTIVKHGGYYYLIGSAGSCCEGANSTYHLVVARSENLLGPYVNKRDKDAMENNFSGFLYKSTKVIGPGHCSEWMMDDAGDYWMVYHGYDASDPDAGRKVYLDKVLWDKDGWPYVKGAKPSVEATKPYIDQTQGIHQIDASSANNAHISISPKRCRSLLTIHQSEGQRFAYSLTNMNGQTIKSGHARGHAEVSVDDVPMGLYLVSVTTSHGTNTERIVRY